MKNIKLSCSHAVFKYLIAQKIVINEKKVPLFPGAFGIYGHGNVACIGQAMEEFQSDLPGSHICTGFMIFNETDECRNLIEDCSLNETEDDQLVLNRIALKKYKENIAIASIYTRPVGHIQIFKKKNFIIQ